VAAAQGGIGAGLDAADRVCVCVAPLTTGGDSANGPAVGAVQGPFRNGQIAPGRQRAALSARGQPPGSQGGPVQRGAR
jgi:hypothetical protein